MIAIFTDFGLEGPYLGQVKAVLGALAPHVPAVDLFADLPPFRVKEAAYLLAAYVGGLPDRSVFLCVVDPGVGGARLPLALKIDGQWYVGPDNGLFEPLIRRARSVESHIITPPESPRSATFHGRDLFAPAAARLALGDERHLCSHPVSRRPDWPDDWPAVVYVDRFGNLITGLRAAALRIETKLRIRGRILPRARTFSDVPPGELFWYENANGLAEIAANCGNAAMVTEAGVGEALTLC